MYLCISATFLDPLFHGCGDDEPEWPPSPMRLFQALLAGARTGCRQREWSDARADAFRWLGRVTDREPPVIVTPRTRRLGGYTQFVPNNDSDKIFDRQERLTSKSPQPHQLVDGDTVHYLWHLDQKSGTSDQVQAQELCRVARQMMALGWGIDQVAGNGRLLTEEQAAELPGHRWRPWCSYRSGAQQWRVPTAGSLDDLDCAYASFVRRVDGRRYHPPLKVREFRMVDYLSATTIPPRPCAVFELPEGVAFRQEATAKVAAMLRSLASRSAREDTHEFPGGSEAYVAGHLGKESGASPRFSYLPLPSIGHQHTDGLIRRVLIAEPLGGDGRQARWAKSRLCSAPLRDDKGNERGVLLRPWRSESKTMARRYVAPSRVWSTVTPVILPGFDDRKRTKAEALTLTAVRHAGLPVDAIAELTLRKAPFWPGSQHPHQYFVPSYLKELPGWHVRIVFHEPVPGPLAVGAGRHVGLGLFATWES
jgi:CRISPR-associated protein Csb2